MSDPKAKPKELSPYDLAMSDLDREITPRAPQQTPLLDTAQLPTMDDGRVPVAFRDGKTGTILAKDAEQHARLGGTFLAPEEYAKQRLQHELDKTREVQRDEANKWRKQDILSSIANPLYAPIKMAIGGEAAEASSLGFARGATMGLSDAAMFGLDVGGTHLTGVAEALKGKDAANAYREYNKRIAEENPGSAVSGEILGTVASILATEGAGAALQSARGVAYGVRGAEAAEGILGGLARRVEESAAKYGAENGVHGLGAGAGKILGTTIKNAPLNAAFGAGQEVSRAALDNDELTAEHVAAGTIKGLVAGAVADVGMFGAGKALGALRKEASPLVSQLIGKAEQKISKLQADKIAEHFQFDKAKLAQFDKEVVGGSEAVINYLKNEVGTGGSMAAVKPLEQVGRETTEKLAAAGERLAGVVRDADAIGFSLPAKDILRAAEESLATAPVKDAALAQEAISSLLDRSGLAAERNRLKGEFAEQITQKVKQDNAKLFEGLSQYESDLATVKARISEIDTDLADAAAGRPSLGGFEPSTAKPVLAKLRADQARLGRLIRKGKLEAGGLLAGVDDVAARMAAEEADVPLKLSEARRVKDVLKEGVEWHAMPDPIKKVWVDIEKRIEGTFDKFAAESMGDAVYSAAKKDFQLAKVGSQVAQDLIKRSADKGTTLQAALVGAKKGALGGGLAGVMGGPKAMALGAMGGGVAGGLQGAAKQLMSDHAGRFTIDLMGQIVEQKALAKVVGYTDLAMQAAAQGGGRLAKGAILTAQEPKSRREQFQQRIEGLEKYKEDPDKFLAAVEKQLAGVSAGKKQAILMQVDKTMSYLASKIPTSTSSQVDMLTPQLKRPSKVSDGEMAKFNTAYDTAMDPMVAIKAIMDGRYRAEHHETLNTIYPQLTTRGQTIVAANMQSATKRPTPAVSGGIGKLMGMTPAISQTPAYAAQIRATYGPLIPGGSAEHRTQPNRPQASFVKNPNQRMTLSQSVEMGEK